jgi:iron complex outermembrane receptor protein
MSRLNSLLVVILFTSTQILLSQIPQIDSTSVPDSLRTKNVDQNPNKADEEFAKEFGAETITVTASSKVQAVQNVPISVSAIQGDMMRLRNTTTLDQALQYVPGVEINQDNISIRGSSGFSFGIGSRAVVLLDGFPLIAADNGDVKFDALPVYNIERIEVIKGAGSALYGTSAIGGVINIITESPTEEPSLRFRAYSGLYPQSQFEEWQFADGPTFDNGADIAYSARLGDFDLTVNGGVVDATGYRDYNESMRLNTYANLVWNATDMTKLRLLTGYATETKDDWVYWRGVDSATLPALRENWQITGAPLEEPYTQTTSDKITAMLGLNHILDNGAFFNARAGVYITSFNNGLAGLNVPVENFIDYNAQLRQSDAIAFNSEVQYNAFITDGYFFTGGISAQVNDVNSLNFGDNTQTIFSGYSQLEISDIEDFIFTVGARLDQEQTDTIASPLQFSPKFGVSYSPTEELSFRSSIGRGFRAPIIAERYAAASFAGFNVIPNLDLKPETSWSAEVGGIYNFDVGFPLSIEASGFYNLMNDLIEPTFNENGLIFFDNIVNAEISGAEIAVRTFIGGLIGLETAVTILNPRNLDTDAYLNYRSNTLWYSRLLLPWGDFVFSADYRYKSEFESIDVLLASQVDDAFVFNGPSVIDLRVRYDFENLTGLPVSAILNVANALDHQYTIMVGNLGPTRLIQLTLETEL